MPFVYILKNEKGNYYIGSTIDIEKRLKHHTGGHTPSTYRMGKLALVFSQKFETLKEARNVESRLKKLKRHDYINRIVKDGIIKMAPG